MSLGAHLWNLMTAPGVVVHEFAHKLACDLAGVPVTDVAYFRLGDPPGYVRHQEPSRYLTSFAISVAPFFVNTVIASALFAGCWLLLSTVTAGPLEPTLSLLEALLAAPREVLGGTIVLAWLGFATGLHAFPSTGDANTLWSRTRSEWRTAPLVIAGIPFVILIYLVNLLSWAYADVLYALALGIAAFALIGAVI